MVLRANNQISSLNTYAALCKNWISSIRFPLLYYNFPYKKSRVLTSKEVTDATLLKMLLDSAETILLIFLGHFDEITQTFLEFLGSFSRSLNKTDPNPLVGI